MISSNISFQSAKFSLRGLKLNCSSGITGIISGGYM
jgi:hypothetical protein